MESAMLVLPSRHHALHILGVLAKGKEMRFGELVKATKHEDVQVNRGLGFLKENHFVRGRARKDGQRVVVAYSISPRGRAAWDAYQEYAKAVEDRQAVLGATEAQAMQHVLTI